MTTRTGRLRRVLVACPLLAGAAIAPQAAAAPAARVQSVVTATGAAALTLNP